MLGKLFKNMNSSLFLKACRHGDENQVRMMLNRSPDLADVVDSNGTSGLLYASFSGNNRIVSLMLAASEKTINTQEPTVGSSPLGVATLNGNIAIVRELLKYGADPEICDLSGVTPLHIAVDNEQHDISMALIQAGADMLAKDGHNTTPLDLYERIGHKEPPIELHEAIVDQLANNDLF